MTEENKYSVGSVTATACVNYCGPDTSASELSSIFKLHYCVFEKSVKASKWWFTISSRIHFIYSP